MKVAVITCYDQNDYIRARALRTAFQACPGVQTIVVKNQHKGLLRYVEVPLKILRVRFSVRPDAYVITFRGYEMLPLLLALKGRKPLIFDELINAAEYLQEQNRVALDSLAGRLFRRWYGRLVRRCRFILADTQEHAAYSARISRVPAERFVVLPMAAEESLFYPSAAPASAAKSEPFIVFYYGNGMTPLHGLQYVLDAAVLLKDRKDIRFNMVGGKQKGADACAVAAAKGARVTYETWVPFEEMPARARSAGLCLGGPFGSTLQSQFVVTGKATQFMACAAPVLIGKNKVSGAFIDKQNCLLVPPANAQAIVEAITWGVAHPTELKRIGAAGRRLYEKEFSQAVVNAHILALVGRLEMRRP